MNEQEIKAIVTQLEIVGEVNDLIVDSGWVVDDYDRMDGFDYVTIRKPAN